MSTGTLALWLASAAATLVVDYKWLRVAQREHYEPGRVTALVNIWSRVNLANIAVGAVAVLLFLASFLGGAVRFAAFGVLLLVLVLPLGLPLLARSKPLAWTPRLRRATAVLLVLDALVFGLTATAEWSVAAALFAPLLTDVALWLVAPVERRLSRKFVVSAKARLKRVGPTVVAITGSYGKTSTKGYAAQLIGDSRTVAASPASFNNLMGLSRAVNERLPEGTEVFIAEMGTYGRGEIARLCEIFPPDIAAITTIGEAHLERMKDRATIVAAKSEITVRPGTVVLNVDVPELAALADTLEASKRVLRCSTEDTGRGGRPVDASVLAHDGVWSVSVLGTPVTDVAAPPTGHPINLAVAVGLALAVGVTPTALAKALAPGLPTAAHRAEIATTDTGVHLIDDTYNANPTGAAQALTAAAELAGADHQVFTITPGMIELGASQVQANRMLAGQATAAANMRLAVTGKTNRQALLNGADGREGTVATYPDRESAARIVLAQARAGDVIVYLNDLPDHYP